MGAWLRRLAVVAVLGFPIAVIGTRLGLYHFRFGFQILTWTVYLSAAVFLVGLVVAFWHRQSNPDSAKKARHALMLCLLPLVGIGSQVVTARTLPMIHNITTDITDPPQFDKVVALRGEESNPLDYDAEELGPLQSEAYPEVTTLVVDVSPTQAFEKSLSVVSALGWELVSSDSEAGLIEATETTTLWGFKDDVVIRIQQTDGKTEVDLRSVSRVGLSDLGANAKRISRFMEAFQQ